MVKRCVVMEVVKKMVETGIYLADRSQQVRYKWRM